MSSWERVRRDARRRHKDAVAALPRAPETEGCSPLGPDARALLRAAALLTGVKPLAVGRGDPLLAGGVAQFDPQWRRIVYSEDESSVAVTLNLAHEFGHVWLDDAAVGAPHCLAEDIDPEAAAEPGASGVDRITGYGPAELRERRANVFAREFLLPAQEALRLHACGTSADAIAHGLGLPRTLVLQQLTAALLAPDGDAEPDESGETAMTLDESQRAAAEVKHGPLLVEAGPGTGKTRTLIGRILHLLATDVPPERIVALTFSNRAAEEMRERIARTAPEAAERIWIGTFHAFALDLLRRYYSLARLPARFGVIDPAESLALLEDGLPALHLSEYRNLRAPGRPLREVLTAIARAQDEDIGPARYAKLVEAMAAQTEDEAAEGVADRRTRDLRRAREIARVYGWYDRQLRERGVLDFGGLLCRAIALLRRNAGVRAQVQATHAHVLVDEYQDVNRASGLLLRLIAGNGRGLWVVGDPRQAIYRFRGASPANVARFSDDFPGANGAVLRRNYRSRPAVLDAVASFAETMPPASEPFQAWEADRAPGGEGVLRIDAPDRPSEAASLATQITRLHDAGVAFREQAVLCRTHATLARAGAALESAGVPTLYLGNLFERPEARDMLALLQLLSGDGRALLRVAEFPEYAVSAADAALLIRTAHERRHPFPGALALADQLAELSPSGRIGLQRLAEHLRGLHELAPAAALAEYLIARGSYLQSLPGGEAARPQQRLALYQLLQFVREQGRAQPDLTAAGLLRRIRRLALYGDERDLRQLPERAASLDAVRLLTVHAAKGLEFAAVHLTELGAGHFPVSWRGPSVPLPPGMIAAEDDAKTAHVAEEECLFFVALSRARETLILSRPARLDRANSNPSPYLARIERAVTAHRTAPAVAAPAETPAEAASAARRFTASELDLYLRCPRRYLYEEILGLGRESDETAYHSYSKVAHGIVSPVLHGVIRGQDAARRKLDELWNDAGPTGDANAESLLGEARKVIDRAAAQAASATALQRRTFLVRLAHGDVSLLPDNMEEREGVRRMQRVRLGPLAADEHDANVYALYHRAARQEADRTGQPLEVETLALGDDAPPARAFVSTDRRVEHRLSLYDDAMLAIRAGSFPAAAAEPRFCPTCPHYYICGAGGPSLPE